MRIGNTVFFGLSVFLLLSSGSAAASLEMQPGGWNVLDTGNSLEWRTRRSMQTSGHQPSGNMIGDYNDTLSRYGPDSTYRFPTPAEVDDIIDQLFPGFVANARDGRCSESFNSVDSYPGQVQHVDDFLFMFGSDGGTFHAIYENASGVLRGLYVRRPFGSEQRIVCPTGYFADYAKYRNDPPYPSTPLGVLVVRDDLDLSVSPLPLYSYIAPAEIGLRAGFVDPYNGELAYQDDAIWTAWGVPTYWGGYEWGDFQLFTDNSPETYFYRPSFVRVTSLDYTTPCDVGDLPLGTGWCRRSFVDPAWVFTGDNAAFPDTFMDGDGGLSVDNVVVEQIRENVMIDYDPWSTANEIRPKSTNLFAIQITTTSIADGDQYDFDAANVDPYSLRVGPGNQGIAGSSAILTADYDNDGDTDYIFGFRTDGSGMSCFDTEIIIAGLTYSGDPIAGKDNVVPVDCEEIVDIDVDPFNDPNEVRPDDDYNVTVAVLGMSTAAGDPIDLDATQVDPYSLQFGPFGAPNVLSPITSDFNGDSLDDVMFGFRMQDSGIACEETEFYMSGALYSTLPIEGTDDIVTVDCEATSCHP